MSAEDPVVSRDRPVSLRISGNPTPEEVAAVVVALDQVAATDAATRRPLRRAPWQHAARVEAVGGRIVRSPADLPALRST